MRDAEERSFGGTGQPPDKLLSRLRERLGEGPLARQRKRRAKPGKRPAAPKDGLPPQPSLASEGGGFEEGRTLCTNRLQDMNSRHADHDIP